MDAPLRIIVEAWSKQASITYASGHTNGRIPRLLLQLGQFCLSLGWLQNKEEGRGDACCSPTAPRVVGN